jgi:hypothetical protein
MSMNEPPRSITASERSISDGRSIATRHFPTLAVVGAYSEAPLEEEGFPAIREVYMHLMPGHGAFIGSVAYQASRAPQLLAKQFPELRELPVVTRSNWKAVADLVLKKFGPLMAVAGPAEILDDPFEAGLDYIECVRGTR